MEFQNDLDEIVAVWLRAKTPTIFTGAGMSTESGLPDFRSAQGLWKTRPERLATLEALQGMPNEFYFFYQWRISRLWAALPNAGHLALASLQQQGYADEIITQNVDGLHQRAGAKNVIELHGSLRTVRCLECDADFDSRDMLPCSDTWESEYAAGNYQFGKECQCSQCGGLLRPNVILFGEQLPHNSWNQAITASKKADFFVALGSSLTVSPANLCPQLAVENDAKLLIINNDPTPMDHKATWVIRENIGDVLSAILEKITAQQ